MGAIRDLIKDFDGASKELENAREAINALTKLAEAKASEFELAAKFDLVSAGSEENRTVPIESIINSVTQTHAFNSSDASKIADTVNSALKSFVKGGTTNVLDGVGKLISEALTMFLGASQASEDTTKMYFVMAEDLSIVQS